MNYTIKHINRIVKGKLLQCNSNPQIDYLLLDSRKVNFPETSLFFAITGERHDGHNFIHESYTKGVRNFVVNKKDINSININDLVQANILQVPDTLKALQQLTSYHRKKFKLPVIGITGSNGKTMVKEWLFQLLHPDHHIVRSPKSYNSQVGAPLSVWQINSEHELAIFEAGISQKGEMKKLQAVIQPTIGLFTNIGHAHDEGFSSSKQKLSEKLLLFKQCEVLISCKDHNDLRGAAKKTFTWSKKKEADLKIASVVSSTIDTEIKGVHRNNEISILIKYTDNASVENAIHCWAVMLYLGYANNLIKERMLRLTPVAMRLQLLSGINNCTLINDSFNSDLQSLSIAIDLLSQQHQHKKKTIILSDILQSGKNEKTLYKNVADLVNNKQVNKIIGIGEAITRQSSQFRVKKKFYADTDSFIKEVQVNDFENEAILIKGARYYGFEKIGKLLQQKDHETVLEISLNAIVHNLNHYQSRLKPDTRIMAMVKAFSYGSGSYEIANILQYHHVDYLAVAYADEGVELREAGITLPIMVMNPEQHSFDTIIKYRLEPEIYNFSTLQGFADRIRSFAGVNVDLPYPMHIKLDTGMHRLGFLQDELTRLIKELKEDESLVAVRSVFTHLAASDQVFHDEFTRDQISNFKSQSKIIERSVNYSVLKHVLNSGGIVRFPSAQFDMVRLGIGLYGIDSANKVQSKLQNVSTLKTTISQIKEVKKKESIGYNRKKIARQNMTIATVGIGYADGLNRKLGNGKGKMMVKGKFVPIVGNVCMDMCMLDITGINAQEGDEVIVFGEKYTISEMARDLDTIPYEVLTSISQRVKRIYLHE
ncbi:bifunctional UDP-N-acetylmuramoyl-tripeptide:D-alanyl-D-alanine ligase/alanine racemase [Candidatus Amoebophilus asiaticus]|nr:bifunctional UDP-N-acetylmuramoyl-tripeptide:D-alanyl-D-alanine ligase/alanine racemase [Candidatus Amoebophilus asiaticus]